MMPTPHRRDILRALAATGALAASPKLAFAGPAQGAARDLMVVVFQRGACDGLNLVGPAADPFYVEARPAELRVTEGDERPGIPLANGLDDKAGFHLHPEAAGLGDLYRGGQLAILHAVGLTTPSRSHFVAQDMMDKGVARAADIGRVPDGWLARLAAPHMTDGALFAAGSSPSLPLSYAGLPGAVAVPDVNAAAGLPGGPVMRQILGNIYPAGDGGTVPSAMRRMLDASLLLDARIDHLPDGKPAPYERAARYESAGEAGRALMAVARLARLDVGLELAAVDVGGWDTHEGQPGRFGTLTGQLSRALTAFWDDLGSRQATTTVIVMTEFGRRFRANRSNGTDHGRGGAMMVLGSTVRGGRMYGRWPGLGPDQLEDGVDLKVTTDYRAVLAEVLARRWSPADAARAFPGFASSDPSLGLIA